MRVQAATKERSCGRMILKIVRGHNLAGGPAPELLRLGPAREPLLAVILLRDVRVLLSKDHLDVARARLVRVDATVGPEGPSAVLLRAVHLDVHNVEVLPIEALHLRVRLGVLQQTQHVLTALDRPSSLAVRAALVLRLRRAADAAAVLSERDAPGFMTQMGRHAEDTFADETSVQSFSPTIYPKHH